MIFPISVILRNAEELRPTGSDGGRDVGRDSGVFPAGVILHGDVTPRRVGDVYVGAPVHVTGATLAARAPCTIEETGEFLAPRGRADDRLRREVRGQGADGRIDVERYQEEKRRAAGCGDEGQRRRGVEVKPLTAGTPWRSAPRRAEPQLQQLATT